MARKSDKEKLEELEAQKRKIEQRMKAVSARQKERERKADTRRKVILGGLLLDAAEKDPRYARVVQTLIDRISRDADHKAFEGWTPPAPVSPSDDDGS